MTGPNWSPFRAALWSAVSSAAQAAAEKISLIDQLDKERAVCAARGWRVAAELTVAGHSREYASLDTGMREMPELAELMTLARDGAINLLVAYDTNRFRGLQSAVIKTLASYGTQTYSLNQPLEPANPATFRYYHSDTQTIMTHVGSLISDVEISALRRRYDVGMPRRVDVLGLHYAAAPYGYRKPPGRELDPRAVLEQVPAECAVLLEMRRRYLAGEGATAIAAWLKAEKIPPPRRQWSHRSVLVVLTNPYYAGLVSRHQGRARRDIVTGRLVSEVFPVGEWLISPGRHVGLWTEADWRQLVELRARRGSRTLGQVSHVHIFSRLLVCAECGETLRITVPLLDGTAVYRCMAGASRNGHGITHEPAALEVLREQLQDFVRQPVPQPEPEQGDVVDAERICKSLAANDAARARYQRLYARDGISDSDLDQRLGELAAERHVLEQAQAAAGDKAARLARRANRVRTAESLLANFDTVMTGPAETANTQLAALIELALVKGHTITDMIWHE